METSLAGTQRSFVCGLRNAKPIKVNPLGPGASAFNPNRSSCITRITCPRIPEKIRAAGRVVANHQLRGNPIAAVYPGRRFGAGSCSCSGRRQSPARFFHGLKLSEVARYGKSSMPSAPRRTPTCPSRYLYRPPRGHSAHPTQIDAPAQARFGLIVGTALIPISMGGIIMSGPHSSATCSASSTKYPEEYTPASAGPAKG